MDGNRIGLPIDGFAAWQGRNVLVTGAGGFVASALCAALIDRGAFVTGIVRDSPGDRLLEIRGIRQQVNLVHGSIVDYALVSRALNEYEIDVVFHVAAQALVLAANRSPLSTFESNIKGTWTVLEAVRHSRPTARVVVASSDKAYGTQPVLPYQEDTPLLGIFPYDASKACTDILARSYAASFDLPVAVTRCANIFGGGDFNWSRLIPGTIRAALRGEDVVIRSDGTPERDYLYIADAVNAYLTLAEHAADSQVRGRAFNFGNGTPISVIDLTHQILAKTGARVEPQILGASTGEIDRQYLDSTLAHHVLGWHPRFDMDSGLERTIDWYAQHLEAPVLQLA
jgi:CDP-glucose 4,6-dehydratase